MQSSVISFISLAVFFAVIIQSCQALYSSQCRGSCGDPGSTLYCPSGSFVTDIETRNGKYGSTSVVNNVRITCRKSDGTFAMKGWAFVWPDNVLNSNAASNMNEIVRGISSLQIWGGSLVNSIRVGTTMLGGLGGSSTPWPSPSGVGKGLKLKGFNCHYKIATDVATGAEVRFLTGLQAITA